MLLIIVGTGAMGGIIRECALEEGGFDEICMVEPLQKNWPDRRADLIIDFSHPKAMQGIYEYVRAQGGNIPVVIGTTGQGPEDEALIRMLEKICPVCRRANFSRGIEVMKKLAAEGRALLQDADAAVTEIHHTKKKDSPSGTARDLCHALGLDPEQAQALRLGTVYGQHKVYLALADEVLEISHTAYSKKIFARGALRAGRKLLAANTGEKNGSRTEVPDRG